MAIALGNQKRRFYEAAIRRFSKRNEVEIYCLRVEGKLIGAEVWLLQGDTCVALKTAYDEDYSNLSPGVLAFDLGYQHHAKRNTAKTINTITDTAAVNDWQPDRLQYLNHAVFNKTFRGRLLRVKSAFRRSS